MARDGPIRKRLFAALAALLCLLVAGAIPGTALVPVLVLDAPELPERVTDRDAAVDVTVTAAEGGALVPGADVRAFAILDGRAYASGAATTDSHGWAHLGKLPRAEHWITVEARGFARGSSHVALAAGTRAIAIELGAEHRLAVVVHDEQGAPVADAEIEVLSTGLGADPLPVGARTASDGTTEVGRLGKPPWMVTARAVGYEEVTQRGLGEGVPALITLRRLGAFVVSVVSESGASPIEGARVEIAGPALWPARVGSTGSEGRVKIGGLSAGSYAMRAVKGELVSPIELGVMLGRGEEKSVVLHLAPGRTLAVHVTDGEGEDADPVPAARVTLVEGGLSPFPIEAVTDRDGRARLGPIAPGPATLSALAEGFVPRSGLAAPDPPATDVTIALVKAGVLTGRVVDGRGFPVDGATIEIIGTDFYGSPIADDPRRSTFREAHFDAMLSGPAPLVPAGELGVMPGPVPPIPHGPSLGFAPPAAGVPAMPDMPGLRNTTVEPWVTRDDGTFRAAPASPGRIRALVRHPEYVDALSDVVTLASGAEAHVEIVMKAGGTLEGQVVDTHGFPVAGARVLVAAVAGAFERSTRTASDGTFAFAAVPDALVVTATGEGDANGPESAAPSTRVEVSVPEGGSKSITLTLPDPRDPLPVRVNDERGYPLEEAELGASSLDPSQPLRATVFTDRYGEAKIGGARGLALRVEASAPGRAPRVVTTDASATELVVTLLPAETATGEVVASRGRDPIAGADVALYTELGVRRARTDADGAFSIAELAPGAAQLRVRAAGYAPVTRAVTVPSSSGARPFAIGRVELGEESSVEGTVVDAHGDPVQGARVARDHVPTYLAVGSAPAKVAVTDAKGRFKLGELPEGTIKLEAYAPDLGRAVVEGVKVSGGRTTSDVRITLASGEGASSESSATGGVAVTLGETSEPREVVLVSVAEGSQAERAGLAPNDIVVEVDGARVHTIEEARARLSGPLSDDVVVKVRRGDRTETVRVSREQVRK